MASIPGFPNLTTGFKGSRGGGFVIRDNLVEIASALLAVPAEIEKGVRARNASYLGKISVAAERIFRSSILRPSESGFGAGGRRQTGNFTFGKRSGGGATFQGVQIDLQDGRTGFGFPDVAQADARTDMVWRALEFGLTGENHTSKSLGTPGLNEFLPPKPKHRLPRRFLFAPPSASPARSVMIPGRGNEYRKAPGGIPGKHFIEGAWNEILESMTRDYETVLPEAFRAKGF